MIRKRSARALAGGLIVTSLLVFATAALAATVRKFSGRTSQQQAITFQTAHGFLTHLQFHINDTCPSGHIWRVHDYNFPKIQIANSKFDQKFKSRKSKATAVVKGTFGANKASGTVTERRFIKSEHHYCSGSMKFTATRHK
jgi:hypothetical protein